MDAHLGIGALIRDWRSGDIAARDLRLELLHPDARTIASAQLRRGRNISLSSGQLINIAIPCLVNMGCIDIADRAHVIALTARLMRNILVNRARQQRADNASITSSAT